MDTATSPTSIILFKNYLLSAGATNTYGVCNAQRSSYKYYDINARLLLPNFKPFKRYNVYLKNIASEDGTFGTNDNDRAVTIQLTVNGLTFLANYDIANKTAITQTIDVCSLVLPPSGSVFIDYEDYCVGTCETTQLDKLEFTFQYNHISDGTIANGNFARINFTMEFREVV